MHNADLAQTSDVRQAALMVNDLRTAGYYVMIWASLPCGAWSTWQYINAWKGAEEWERLKAARLVSMHMVKLLEMALRQTSQLGVFAAFEWPRRALPWKSPFPEFRALMTLMPHTADWDGCQFGLVDDQEQPVRKMWKLITNFLPLRTALHGRLCQPTSGHTHAECRGKVATLTERYTRELADEVAHIVTTTQIDEEGHVIMPLEPEPPPAAEAEPADIPIPDDDEEEDEEGRETFEEVEARVIKTLPRPHEPTILEKYSHEVTHLPTAPWCKHCIAGKAVDDPHHTLPQPTEAAMNLCEMDYGFLKTELEGNLLPVLVGEHTFSGSGVALPCQKKGPQDVYVLRELEDWLNELGLLGPMRLRVDSEPSIVAVAKQLAARRVGRTILETTPVRSSSSLGAAERRIRSMASQIRTLRSALEETYGIKLGVTQPLFTWLVRHASFLFDRFQPSRRHEQQTPYFRLNQKPYNYPLCQFGSMVMARNPAALELGRAEPRWEKAVWVGRSTTSAEHIVLMEIGARRVRSIRMLPKEEYSLSDMEKLVVWPIWQQQPTSTQPQDAQPGEESMPQLPLKPQGLTSFTGTKGAGVGDPAQRREALRTFKASKGATAGCAGCDPGRAIAGRFHGHSVNCRRRQLEHQEEQRTAAAAQPLPDLEVKPQPMEETVTEPRRKIVGKTPMKRHFEETPEDQEEEERQRVRGPTPGKRTYEETTEDQDEEVRGRLHEGAADTIQQVKRAFYRDVVKPQDDTGTYFVQLYQVAEEPEIFIGTAPGFDEDWRELPYQEVIAARKRELQCVHDFGTYVEIDPEQVPEGVKVIPSRFSYRKRATDVKARIVVQQLRKSATGYTWVELFAAAPTSASHALLAWYAMKRKWKITEGDLTTAFLHADLEEGLVIVIRPPEEINQGKLWLLKKALYGLRISPRVFQQWLTKELRGMGFNPTRACPMTFWRDTDGAAMVAHADNLRLTASDETTDELKLEFANRMKIRWENVLTPEWSAYLGSSWRRPADDEIQVKPEHRHFQKLFETVQLERAKAVPSPAWSPQEEKKEARDLDAEHATAFRSGTGIMQWIAHATVRPRPDLQYTTKELARALSRPTTRDWARLRKVARYCVGTQEAKMIYKYNDKLPLIIVGYSDASYAELPERKSTTGFVIFLQDVAITMGSRTQSIIALSTAEAELLALNTTAAEALFVQNLLRDMGHEDVPIELLTDSSAALGIVSREGAGRVKHIHVRHLWLQQMLREGKLKISKCSTEENLADLLTKHLSVTRMRKLAHDIGLDYDT